MKSVWLRIIYSVHMLAPLPLVARHIDRIHPDTAHALRALFS